MRVPARVGRDDRAVGVEPHCLLGGPLGRPLLVRSRLLVPAHEDDAGEAQPAPVLSVKRAHEAASLEEGGRVPERRPVVLAARHGPVEELGRLERPRQVRLSGGNAVDVLVVERPEIGQLHERDHRRQPLVHGSKLEALDPRGLGLQCRPREILRDGECRLARPGLQLLVAVAPTRVEGENDVRGLGEGRQRRTRPRHIDDRLLLVQGPLLGRKIETGDDGHAVEAVGPAFARPFLKREGRAPVRPDPGLDRVEDVREPDGVSGLHDAHLDAIELRKVARQLWRKRRELPSRHAALR